MTKALYMHSFALNEKQEEELADILELKPQSIVSIFLKGMEAVKKEED